MGDQTELRLVAVQCAAGKGSGCLPGASTLEAMPWDDDDDWVGEPPEGRHTRDQAKPDYWRQPWPWAGAGTALLVVIVVLVIVLR